SGKHSKHRQNEQITAKIILYFKGVTVNITKNREKDQKVRLKPKMRETRSFGEYCDFCFMQFP
ncbi:MAG: hypothetical protein J5916_08510, partial [Oscillospiraceae bacterium]|nr:hypothetical protein [Oscillospiraceae bacterium]